MKYKKIVILKVCFLFCACVLAVFLLFAGSWKDVSLDHTLVFVLDVNRTMNTQDVSSGVDFISRLDAAKYSITKIINSESGFSYGLILFNGSTDYLVPATFDTWTFLLYLSGVTTNLLPDSDKNFAILADLIHENTQASYIILSDFDTDIHQIPSLSKTTSLLGVWSKKGDYVRYSNGVRYYDDGVSVFSARNDRVAEQFNLAYHVVDSLDTFSPQQNMLGSRYLPLSQRIFLYALLGVFSILALFI